LNIVYEDVNCESNALLEHWNFCTKSIYAAWDFLDWCARDTYEFDISCANSCASPPCIPNYAPPVYEICHCFGRDNNSCPYYIYANDFARFASIIETMNDQEIEFANYKQEYDV